MIGLSSEKIREKIQPGVTPQPPCKTTRSAIEWDECRGLKIFKNVMIQGPRYSRQVLSPDTFGGCEDGVQIFQ